MKAKDGSVGFDFEGTYDVIKQYDEIAYAMGDGRKVQIIFLGNGTKTEIEETFEAENTNPVEMQKTGWQAILDNFKNYSEMN